MLKELSKRSCRINSKRSSCDYEKVALLYCLDSIVNVFVIEVLFIKNDVRPYDSAALFTVGNAFLGNDVFEVIFLAAVHAVVSKY